MSLSLIILCANIALTAGAGVLLKDSVTAAVGGSVRFTTSLDPAQTELYHIEWDFGTINVAFFRNNSFYFNPEYRGRVGLFPFTGCLELYNLFLNDSGEYNVTIRPTAGDAPMTGLITLDLYEKITNISVKSSSDQPVETTTVNLTCDASGSIFITEWMIHDLELKPSENIVFYDQNQVLSIRFLSRLHSGKYTCRMRNPVSSQSVDYTMNVNYGPDSAQIYGRRRVQEGTTLKLSCSAESVPTANFTWTHNGTTVAQSSEYTKNSTVFSDSGEYVCRATNDVTMKSSEASLTVLVTDANKGLSAGAVAGITVGLLMAVAGAAAGGIFMLKHKKQRQQNNKRLQLEHVYENTSNIGNFKTDKENKHVHENDHNIYDRHM